MKLHAIPKNNSPLTVRLELSPSRSVDVCNTEGEDYRFGFNGKEKDNQTERSGVLEGNSFKIKYFEKIAGKGNHYTALFWEYDTRLGRRWNLDPVFKEYESPYSTFGNNPILNIDWKGDDTTISKPNGEDALVGDNISISDDVKTLTNNSPDGNWNKKVWNDEQEKYVTKSSSGNSTYTSSTTQILDDINTPLFQYSRYFSIRTGKRGLSNFNIDIDNQSNITLEKSYNLGLVNTYSTISTSGDITAYASININNSSTGIGIDLNYINALNSSIFLISETASGQGAQKLQSVTGTKLEFKPGAAAAYFLLRTLNTSTTGGSMQPVMPSVTPIPNIPKEL